VLGVVFLQFLAVKKFNLFLKHEQLIRIEASSSFSELPQVLYYLNWLYLYLIVIIFFFLVKELTTTMSTTVIKRGNKLLEVAHGIEARDSTKLWISGTILIIITQNINQLITMHLWVININLLIKILTVMIVPAIPMETKHVRTIEIIMDTKIEQWTITHTKNQPLLEVVTILIIEGNNKIVKNNIITNNHSI
jgi:hypothetical protein